MLTINTQIVLFVPSLNAGYSFYKFIDALNRQTMKPINTIIIDSGSTDSTVKLAIDAGLSVHTIPIGEFNHGATRQLSLSLCPDADIIIFMTQDAFLASPSSIYNLLLPFNDKKVGAAYGRQLPHLNASPISSHARLFNYPSDSQIKSKKDIPRLGIKAAFISNSFAAYRRSALVLVGGFPSDVILGEDTYVAAKMLGNDWKIAYCAEAQVYHSHNYSYLEEFRRYFDTGVFHSREKSLLNPLGKVEGEGKRFVISELRYLLHNSFRDIPSSLLRTLLKYFGYKLGQMESKLSIGLKKKLSMNKGYWK